MLNERSVPGCAEAETGVSVESPLLRHSALRGHYDTFPGLSLPQDVTAAERQALTVRHCRLSGGKQAVSAKLIYRGGQYSQVPSNSSP